MATLKRVVKAHYGHAIKGAAGTLLPERIVVKDDKDRLVLLVKPAHKPIEVDGVDISQDGEALRKHYESVGFDLLEDGESKALRREGWLNVISSK